MRPNKFSPWRIGIGLVFALLFFGASRYGLANETAPTSLVRVDFPDEGMLEDFASLNVPIYTQGVNEKGGVFLLTEAGPNLQIQFKRLGFTVRLLDQDSQGAAYYWIEHPHPEIRPESFEGVTLLDETDQFLVIRAIDSAIDNIPEMGASVERLFLHPIRLASQKSDTREGSGIPHNPFIQTMIHQVQIETARDHIRDLSGERAVYINGVAHTFYTRYTFASGANSKSTEFVHAYFSGLGLSPYYHNYVEWGMNLRNVIADQPGVTDPDCLILLVGHLDSYSSNPYYDAPGADDNASGATGVLMAAEILSQYQFACTIRYILFTAEEQGYYGSYYYIQNMVIPNQENIVAVINLDMIGYNYDSYPIIELHTRANNMGDIEIATQFSNVIATYQIAITPQIINGGLTWSDHKRFWDAGYPAIMAMEDSTLGVSSDFIPYYHTPSDTYDKINFPYLVEYIRATVGSIAHLAGFIPKSQLYFPLIFR